MIYPFNIRVYGLLFNDKNEVMISDEEEFGFRFSKFPGGGLEAGEGLIDGLKREFMEECNLPIDIESHFYTTDFYVKSAFNDSQVISVYYIVKNLEPVNLAFKINPFEFDTTGDILQAFRWMPVGKLTENDVTFPTDKRVVELLKLS